MELVINLGKEISLEPRPEKFSDLIQNITWTISNLVRFKPFSPLITSAQIMLLIDFFYVLYHIPNLDHEARSNILWALSYISESDDKNVDLILESKFVPEIVEALPVLDGTLVSPALRIIGNILTGNEFQTQKLLDLHILSKFQPFLDHYKVNIRREVCWSISNIAAGTLPQKDLLISSNILWDMPTVFLKNTYKVQKEIVFVIANIFCPSEVVPGSNKFPNLINTILDSDLALCLYSFVEDNLVCDVDSYPKESASEFNQRILSCCFTGIKDVCDLHLSQGVASIWANQFLNAGAKQLPRIVSATFSSNFDVSTRSQYLLRSLFLLFLRCERNLETALISATRRRVLNVEMSAIILSYIVPFGIPFGMIQAELSRKLTQTLTNNRVATLSTDYDDKCKV